jgi:hypothetical protein
MLPPISKSGHHKVTVEKEEPNLIEENTPLFHQAPHRIVDSMLGVPGWQPSSRQTICNPALITQTDSDAIHIIFH